MILENMIDGLVGANSFAHNRLFVRINPHLQKLVGARRAVPLR